MSTRLSLWTLAFLAVSCQPGERGTTRDQPAISNQATLSEAAREGFVRADDGAGRLYYQIVGEGPQTVVVPVGFYLADHLRPLARGRRLVFYDPRGRGRSDAVDTSMVSLDKQLEDLETLREALRIERMALIGWSGLGMEMAVYTLRHPERVTRLVQLAPVAPRQSPYMEQMMEVRRSRMNLEAVEELQAREEAGEFANTPAAYCREVNRLTGPVNFADPANASKAPDVCDLPNEWPVNLWPYFDALLGSFGDYDWRPSLSSIEAPRLVIHGSEDPIPLEGNLEWVEGYANARLLVIDQAGHWPFIERPDVLLPAIDRFLNGEWPAGAELVM